jgi:hypothetical protein
MTKDKANFNEDSIVASLREIGVTTLEQLVSHIIRKTAAARPNISPIFVVDRLDKTLPIRHTLPTIPVIIDGVEYDPRDIDRFDGTPLHFIYFRRKNGSALFEATTDGEQIKTARLLLTYSKIQDWVPIWDEDGRLGLGQIHGPATDHGGSGNSAPDSGDDDLDSGPPFNARSIQMFSAANYGGDWFWLKEGYQYARLSEVDRNTVLFFSGDWNDQISSLAGVPGPVIYFEHANFQGSTLTIGGYTPIPDLTPMGWNDRISSVRYPPCPGC